MQINSPAQRLKMSHASAPRQLRNIILTIPPAMPKPERAIFEMNKRGEKPESLTENGKTKDTGRPADLLADADISRFDKAKKKKKKPQGKKPQQPKDAKQQPQQPREPKEGRPQQHRDNRPQRQPKPQGGANKKPNNPEQQQ